MQNPLRAVIVAACKFQNALHVTTLSVAVALHQLRGFFICFFECSEAKAWPRQNTKGKGKRPRMHPNPPKAQPPAAASRSKTSPAEAQAKVHYNGEGSRHNRLGQHECVERRRNEARASCGKPHARCGRDCGTAVTIRPVHDIHVWSLELVSGSGVPRGGTLLPGCGLHCDSCLIQCPGLRAKVGIKWGNRFYKEQHVAMMMPQPA
jgi:hypothetical protein